MLILPAPLRAQIEEEAEAGYPEEICGFLIGGAESGGLNVTRLVSGENEWSEGEAGTRRERFALSPAQYLAADKEARTQGRTILGFYHSHPDHPARPSLTDLAFARETIAGYVYVIVSVEAGRALDVRAWVLRDNLTGFEAVDILGGKA